MELPLVEKSTGKLDSTRFKFIVLVDSIAELTASVEYLNSRGSEAWLIFAFKFTSPERSITWLFSTSACTLPIRHT